MPARHQSEGLADLRHLLGAGAAFADRAGPDELDVIQGDDLEAAGQRHAQHVLSAHAGGLHDLDRALADLHAGRRDGPPLVGVHFAVLDVREAQIRDGLRHKPVHELRGAGLEGEDPHRLLLRHAPRPLEHQRGLSVRRIAAQHQHVAEVQRQALVHCAEARGDVALLAALVLVKELRQRLLHRDDPRRVLLDGDGLRLLQRLPRVGQRGRAGELRAQGCEPGQPALLFADVDVGLDVCGRGRFHQQALHRVPIARAHGVQHRYGIHRLPADGQEPDRVQQRAVFAAEILRRRLAHDHRDAGGVDQRRADDVSLGVCPVLGLYHCATSAGASTLRPSEGSSAPRSFSSSQRRCRSQRTKYGIPMPRCHSSLCLWASSASFMA